MNAKIKEDIMSKILKSAHYLERARITRQEAADHANSIIQGIMYMRAIDGLPTVPDGYAGYKPLIDTAPDIPGGYYRSPEEALESNHDIVQAYAYDMFQGDTENATMPMLGALKKLFQAKLWQLGIYEPQ